MEGRGEIIPDHLDDDFLEKNPKLEGEKKVYDFFKDRVHGKAQEFHVWYDRQFIGRSDEGRYFDGQSDFIILTKFGVINLEVKGGIISSDGNKWFSTDRNGKQFVIDPYGQSRRNKYAVRDIISEELVNKSGEFNKERYPLYYTSAVWFPDMREKEEIRNYAATDSLTFFEEDLESNSSVLAKLATEQAKQKALHKTEYECPLNLILPIFKNKFSPSFEPDPKGIIKIVNDRIEEAEENLERIVSATKEISQIIFRGGAGTGKTFIANEKARRLSRENKRVLYFTANVNLIMENKSKFKGFEDNKLITYYHPGNLFYEAKLFSYMLNNPDANKEEIDKQETLIKYTADSIALLFTEFPKYRSAQKKENLLVSFFYEAIQKYFEDYIEAMKKEDILFDVLIIDEAQDLSNEFITLLQLLLKDTDKAPSYLFIDDNQKLYGDNNLREILPRAQYVPLSENFRNSKKIFKISYQFYEGDETKCNGLDGLDISFEKANSPLEIKRKTTELLNVFYKDGLTNIAVLHGDSFPEDEISSDVISERFPSLTNLYLVEKEEKLKGKIEAEQIKVKYPLRPADIEMSKKLKMNFNDLTEDEYEKLFDFPYRIHDDYFKYENRKIGPYFAVSAGRKTQLEMGNYEKNDVFKSFKLPEDAKLITYDYISNFKGLEADIIILVDIDRSMDIIEDIYVGLSRARAQLIVISGDSTINRLKNFI